MEKELGKWLIDIAKYMTTAILLSSIFSNIENTATTLMVVFIIVLTLCTGLWLIKRKNNT